MTQEQKDLLLKDLCARLPYNVKCAEVYPDGNKFENEWDIIKISKYVEDGIHISNCKTIYGYCSSIENIKPYLFPLSSMTEEQKKDIFHNGKFYIDRHNSLCRFPMYEDDYDFVTMEDCLEIFNKLNKYHFDYRGLIPMGLANDATGKNIY